MYSRVIGVRISFRVASSNSMLMRVPFLMPSLRRSATGITICPFSVAYVSIISLPGTKPPSPQPDARVQPGVQHVRPQVGEGEDEGAEEADGLEEREVAAV